MARAFIDGSEILVLDEPSAALDIVTEYEIFENTLWLIDDKTVFFITHRLSNVVSADIILFLKGGVISEQGTHRERMGLNRNYVQLFRLRAQR